MPSDGDTPSGGWKAVYAAMDAATGTEESSPGTPEATERVDGRRATPPDHFAPAD
ncbi:hypothetical protein [Halorarius halobius]|uniref:hypothetical protein n=1 Tax=Halorarius halobius TaxID=2962671 RepID=UPI0020CFADDF|nr:hypothetical protein [Halorarius halobius]